VGVNFEQAKRKALRADILDVAQRHGVLSRLKKAGGEYIGPCPNCGGTDRFGINPRKLGKNGKRGLFGCRRCDEGGDAIDLERFLSGTRFGTRSKT
jgi:Zinc-binding domain of primase-helicase